MSNWRVILGDCLDVLGRLPESSVDLVVTDPPYGVTTLKWDKIVRGWAALVDRVLKPSGSVWVFGSMAFVPDIYAEMRGWKYAQDIVWEKHNGSGLHSDRFKRVHEHAIQFYRGPWASVFKNPLTTPDATKRTVRRKAKPVHHQGARGPSHYVSEDGGPRLMRSVIYCRSCHGYAVHPTQKPVGILRPLIENSCPVGGIVLDPFAGSGSTGVAAIETGRAFVGIEVDPENVKMAERRIGEAANHLFAGSTAHE